MADEAQKTDTAPKAVKMPRAVHQLHTGPKPEQVIEPGTLITDEVAKKHKFDDQQLGRLQDAGAIELVDILKG